MSDDAPAQEEEHGVPTPASTAPDESGKAALDPSLMFGISLLLSLALWWPSLTAAMHGDVDITVAGLRYLAALGLSWVAVYGVASLIANYAHEEPATPPALPPGPVQHPLRRDDDEPAVEEAPAPAELEQPAA
jgi:hypothetical protein